jgi:hypothetical protein
LKRLITALTIAMCGGVLHASVVIDCSGDKTAVNSCYASNLPNFTTQLDWAVFGTPDGTIHNGVWTANNVLPGTSVSVTTQGTGATEGLRLANNYGSVFSNGSWQLAQNGPPTQSYSFPGHFDAPPNTGLTSAVAPGDPGDHLIGLALDGSSIFPGMVVNFSSGVSEAGFRASSAFDANFQLRVQLFTGMGGTGTLLRDSTFSFNGSGGICNSLFVTVSNPPSPCNDAPFIAALNYNQGIQSMVISSSDTRGFYVGNLWIGNSNIVIGEAPEPSAIILSGCGIALLVAGRKRLRRS